MRTLTRQIKCETCGASLVVASGYNALALSGRDLMRIAHQVGWTTSRCPKCTPKNR